MVLDNFKCRGIILIWIIVGHGPALPAERADGVCLDISLSLYFFLSLSLSLRDGWTYN